MQSPSKTHASRFSMLGLLALMALSAVPSMATITVTAGVDNSNTDNVLFNTNGLINDAFLVTGTLNNGPLSLVEFTGTEKLHTNGGQARIESLDQNGYSFLSFYLPNNTFTKLVFNLNTLTGGSGSVQITIDGVLYDVGSNGADPISNGSNFFTIEATGGQTITHLSFQTTGTDLLDTRQIRIGGVAAQAPEPGTFLTLGAGLAGLSFFGWKRRRAQA